MKLRHGLAALSLLALGATARAEVTATVTAVSDYDFRGITQTAQDPALQGSIDYTHESGFYIGAWGSNIDFDIPNDPSCCDGDIEVDIYAGFRGGDQVTWDVGGVYYTYPSSDDIKDFPEIYASVGYSFLSGKIWYSNDFGGSDQDAWYYEANASYALPSNFGVSAHIGKSDGDYWGDDDYFDWNVGVTYALGHFTLGLKWIDGSDLEILNDTPGDVASSDARAVFSVSTTFPWSSE